MNTHLRLTPFFLFIALSIITYVQAWCEHSRFTDVGSVTCVDYSPDNTMIMTTTPGQVTIWERATKLVLATKTLSAKCAKFSRDSPSTYIGILTNSLDVQIFAGTAPFAAIATVNPSLGGGSSGFIDFSPTNELVVCGGTNNKVKTFTIAAATGTVTAGTDANWANSFICKFKTSTQLGIATSSGNKLDYATITNPTTVTSNFQKSLACVDIDFSATGNYMIAACSTGGKNGVFIDLTTQTQTDIITTASMLTS